MKSIFKKVMALTLSVCMVFSMLIVGTVAASATDGTDIQLPQAAENGLTVDFIGQFDFTVTDVVAALGVADGDYTIISGSVLTDLSTAYAAYKQTNSYTTDYVVLGLPESAAKADVKMLLNAVRAAAPLASIVVLNNSDAAAAAVTELGGESAKLLSATCAGAADMAKYLADDFIATVNNIATLIEQSSVATAQVGHLSTDIWQAVPMVSQELLDAGYAGGEGNQWGLWITYAPSGDGQLAFMCSDTSLVWRSTDGGATWAQSSLGINATAATGLVIDPNNTSRVLVMANTSSAGNSGLYLSTDMGDTWSKVFTNQSSKSHDCRDQLAFDGSSAKLEDGSSSVVYWLTNTDPATDDTADYTYGLHKSTDGGATWALIEGTEDYVGGNLAVDGSGNVYIATASGLYKSTNGGTSFNQIYSGQVYSLTTIAQNSTYKNYVYFTTADGFNVYNGSSCSKVESWNTTEPMRYPDFIAVSALDPNLILVQDNTMSYYTSSSESNEYWSMNSYYSTDGGKTWSDCYYPSTDVDGLWNQNTSGAREKVFSFSPADAKTVLSLGGDFINKSTDGGRTFAYSSTGYNSIKIGGKWNFNVNDPSLIAMGAQDYNGGYSTDGGKTWTLLNWSGNSSIGHAYASYALTDKVVVGQRATAWLSSGGTSYIYETFDGGATFNRTTDYVISGNAVACGLPGDDKVVFLGEYRGVLNDAETDITWAKMDGCVGVYTTYATDSSVMLFGLDADGYVVYSTDGGFNWTKWTTEYASLAADIAYNPKTNTVFIVESHWSLKAIPQNGTPYIVFNGIGASSVCVDPTNADVMYMTSYNTSNRTTKNVWRSIDAGMTWHLLSRTVGDGREGVDGANAAESCRVNPITHELYVTTECNGVWRIAGLPSIMYDGGLSYANLQRVLTAIDNLTDDYTVSDSVRDMIDAKCRAAYINEYEQLNGTLGTATAATVLVEDGDFVDFVDYTTNYNVTLNSSDSTAFKVNRFGTTEKSYISGVLTTKTIYRDTGRGVSLATYDLGDKFNFTTNYHFRIANGQTTDYTSDNYIAVGGLFITIQNFVTDHDEPTQVFSLHYGSSKAPALATSSALTYSTASVIELTYNNGNVTLTVNDTDIITVSAADFYAVAGDCTFDNARISARVYDGFNINYFEGYSLSSYYSANDLIGDMAALELPATAESEAEIIALQDKCTSLGADVTAAVEAYFGGTLPTDSAIEDVLSNFYLAVEAIPSTITVQSEAPIKAARAAYDSLSTYFQGYAAQTEAYSTLTAAEEELQILLSTPVVSVQGAGSITADGQPVVEGTKYELGQMVQYAAVANDGSEFLAWINNNDGNILSYESVINVSVSSNVNITAVFGNSPTADKYTVLIIDRSGFVVQNTTVDAGTDIVMPTAAVLTDYDFAGWASSGTYYAEGKSVTINDSAVFNAKYTPKSSSALYTITVGENATKTPSADTGGYAYNEAVTITADEIDGMYFAGWYKNDVLISYSREYTFYVSGNAHINAAYSDTQPVITPIVEMTDVTARVESGVGIVTFIMERTMPEDSNYIYVGSGMIVTVTAGKTLTLDNVDNTTVRQVKCGYTTGNGQFKLNVKTPSGNAFARAYLTYVDVESGQTVTIYSDYARGQAQIGGIEWGETDF